MLGRMSTAIAATTPAANACRWKTSHQQSSQAAVTGTSLMTCIDSTSASGLVANQTDAINAEKGPPIR